MECLELSLYLDVHYTAKFCIYNRLSNCRNEKCWEILMTGGVFGNLKDIGEKFKLWSSVQSKHMSNKMCLLS